MKTSKRLIAFLLCAAMLLSFAACKSEEKADETTAAPTEATVSEPAVDIRIAALKGPTGMGMAGFFNEGVSDKYKVSIATNPTEIPPMVVKGEVDIAACPINMASVLYKKTNGQVKIIAVNTLGVLSILENGSSIKSVADLKGKKIGATGKGATPEYILNFILKSNGIDPEKDVEITYYQDHAELAALLASGKVNIAMLPEPQVTAAMSKNDKLTKALDLTSEWNKATEGKAALAQGCLVVRNAFLEENPEAVKAFLAEYEKSVKFTNEKAAEASALIAEKGILPNAGMAQKAIPNCNIVFLAGADMKNAAQGTLQVLFDANPASVGGAMPDDNFYYTAK